MTEGHYDLHGLLDYDHGVTLEEFIIFHKATLRLQAERSRMLVTSFATAIGSILDKKVFDRFNKTIDRLVSDLSPEKEKRQSDRRAAMRHTMKELNKLRAILG